MKNLLAPSLILALASTDIHAQTTLDYWGFQQDTNTGDTVTTYQPTSGVETGTAQSLGMTQNGGVDDSGPATPDSTPPNDPSMTVEWKVRGNNGWTSSAAIGTQGVEFSINTAGASGITASFDWYPSSKGEADMMVEYTTDGTNWTILPAADITVPTSPSSISVKTNSSSSKTDTGAYISVSAGNVWYDNVTLNFSSIATVNNDPNFAFKLVNASTGSDDVQASTNGSTISNSSGNWSFDDVDVVAAVPEPSVNAMLALGAGLLLFLGFRRHASAK